MFQQFAEARKKKGTEIEKKSEERFTVNTWADSRNLKGHCKQKRFQRSKKLTKHIKLEHRAKDEKRRIGAEKGVS